MEEWGFQHLRLDDFFNETIFKPFNGKMVNDYCATGSSEHLCEEIFQRLAKGGIRDSLIKVTLFETRKNTIEVAASGH